MKIRLLASITIQDAVQAIDQVAQTVVGDPEVLGQGPFHFRAERPLCVVWTKGRRI